MENPSMLTLVMLCLASLCRLSESIPCPTKAPLIPCTSNDNCTAQWFVCMGRPGQQAFCRYCQCEDKTQCSFFGDSNRVYCPPCDSVRDSCRDVDSRINGEYLFRNGNSQTYIAYCEFHGDHVYMFIPATTSVSIDITIIDPSTTEVCVRHRRSNGEQYDTRMEQLSAYSSQPLSLQYDTYIDYKPPRNRVPLRPFMYLGWLPASVADQNTTQGYRANGQDFDFLNCDANGNSYLAFYFNPNNGIPIDIRSNYKPLMREWINVGTPVNNYLPESYFFRRCEMHQGGCGGFGLTGYDTLDDIYGAVMGFYLVL